MKHYYEDPLTGASVTLARRDTGVKWVNKIWCPPVFRGKGNATRLMRQVFAAADAEGITLTLVVCSDLDGGPEDEDLCRWYEKLGFVKTSPLCYTRYPHETPMPTPRVTSPYRTGPLQLGSMPNMRQDRPEKA